MLEGWLALVLVIGGGVVGLFGHKLYKAVLFLLGFVAGTYLGYILLHDVALVDSDTDVYHYALILFGVCLGFLTLCVYTTALFAMGGVAGMIIAQNTWDSAIEPWFLSGVDNEETYNIVFVVVMAMVGGYVAIKFADQGDSSGQTCPN